MPIEIWNDSLDTRADLTKVKGLVLVELFAKWCGPCRAMQAVLQNTANTYLGRLTVIQIDTDLSLVLTESFLVQALPTLVLVKDGVEVSRKIGAMSNLALDAWIAPYL